MPDTQSLPIGTMLNNRYRIVAELGRGGFGAVYRAWDTRLGIPCAVKENLDAGPESQEQFEREARILAKLTHPNLPRVTDYFFLQRQGQYLVMDYIEGKDLQDMLDENKGPLPEPQVLPWINQILDAMIYLHARKPPIIHRDIKPKNIIISTDGTPYLVDFGIAKLFDPDTDTTRGAQAFTAGYSPVEQYGGGRTDKPSDVYALGATLYTCLTGKVPAISINRLHGEYTPSPRELNPSVSEETDRVVMKAMAVMQQYRFQSSSEFQSALPIKGTTITPPPIRNDTLQRVEPVPNGRIRIPKFILILGISLAVIIGAIFVGVLANQILPLIFPGDPTSALPILVSETPSFTEDTPTQSVETEPSPATATEPVITETTEIETEQVISPTPMGGGGLIAFTSNRTGNNEIYVMNYDGSGIRQLTNNPMDDRVPSWSPDGTRISYQSDTSSGQELFYLEVNTGITHQVTDNTCSDFAPAWSPNGKRFVFYSDCDGNREIYTINIDGTNRRQLTQTTNTYNWFPTWSPDGSKITYSSNQSGKYMVYVMDSDGSNSIALQHGCVSSFSPDGTLIVFTTYCQDNGDIHLMNVDGSDARIITDYDENTNPAFSGDGRLIVFQSELNGNVDIWTMDLSGSNWTQLTRDSSRDSTPVWQPGTLSMLSETTTDEPTRISPVDGMQMILIPAGNFLMGSSDQDLGTMMQMCPGCKRNQILDQQPQREITLDSYWIDKTEVTNSQFSQFVSETGYSTTAEINGVSYVQPGGNINGADWEHPEGPGTNIDNRMEHPVRHTSMIDASAYCSWAGRRLLTEAEWEKAAKGTGNHFFPWGGGAGSLYMNYNYVVGDTAPVGSYPAGASEYGVLDLSGNVWEWTGTYYSEDYYQSMPDSNPQSPQNGKGPVIRGGSWASSEDTELIYLMTAFRFWNYENFSSNLVGFRCAADYP